MAHRVLDQLVGLVLPRSCAGCGAPDQVWCSACRPALELVDRREQGCPRLDRMDGGPPLPVWTAGWYAGPVRSAVLAWKDGGRTELTEVMTAAARAAARVAGSALEVAETGADGPLIVVGVPARPAAVRRRGADLVALLADAVAGELPGSRRAHLLGRRGGPGLHTLAPLERARRTVGYRVVGDVTPGGLHLLVDDVVTTGSTLATCADALSDAGGLVLGAVAVAATPGFTRSALHPKG